MRMKMVCDDRTVAEVANDFLALKKAQKVRERTLNDYKKYIPTKSEFHFGRRFSRLFAKTIITARQVCYKYISENLSSPRKIYNFSAYYSCLFLNTISVYRTGLRFYTPKKDQIFGAHSFVPSSSRI